MDPPVLAGDALTLIDVVAFIRDAGPVGLVVILGYGLLTRKWVPGWLYDRQCKETEFWQNLALRSVNLAEKSADLLQRKGDGQ